MTADADILYIIKLTCVSVVQALQVMFHPFLGLHLLLLVIQ